MGTYGSILREWSRNPDYSWGATIKDLMEGKPPDPELVTQRDADIAFAKKYGIWGEGKPNTDTHKRRVFEAIAKHDAEKMNTVTIPASVAKKLVLGTGKSKGDKSKSISARRKQMAKNSVIRQLKEKERMKGLRKAYGQKEMPTEPTEPTEPKAPATPAGSKTSAPPLTQRMFNETAGVGRRIAPEDARIMANKAAAGQWKEKGLWDKLTSNPRRLLDSFVGGEERLAKDTELANKLMREMGLARGIPEGEIPQRTPDEIARLDRLLPGNRGEAIVAANPYSRASIDRPQNESSSLATLIKRKEFEDMEKARIEEGLRTPQRLADAELTRLREGDYAQIVNSHGGMVAERVQQIIQDYGAEVPVDELVTLYEKYFEMYRQFAKSDRDAMEKALGELDEYAMGKNRSTQNAFRLKEGLKELPY